MLFIIGCFIALFCCLFLALLKFGLLAQPPKTLRSLRDKHVVITGGTKGIGKALAIECVKRESHVTIVARNLDQLKRVKVELEQLASNPRQKIKIIAADLTQDYEQIKRIFDSNLLLLSNEEEEENGGTNELSSGSFSLVNNPNPDDQSAFSPVDILINNAGGSSEDEFLRLDPSVFEQQMKLNYLSAVYTTKALIGHLKRAALSSDYGCRIVFLSSQAGQLGLYGYTAYSASKFALRGFAESLQMEMKPYNIWITVAYPPNTNTEGFELECLHMPEATKLISGTSGLLEPSHVAKNILDSSSKGQFCCYFGSDGWLLANLCSGMSPENNVFQATQQIFLSGLFRFVSFFYLKSFDKIVKQCTTEVGN